MCLVPFLSDFVVGFLLIKVAREISCRSQSFFAISNDPKNSSRASKRSFTGSVSQSVGTCLKLELFFVAPSLRETQKSFTKFRLIKIIKLQRAKADRMKRKRRYQNRKSTRKPFRLAGSSFFSFSSSTAEERRTKAKMQFISCL